MSKISYLLTLILIVPVLGIIFNEGAKLLGLKTVSVPVVGTGSMYPSLYWSKAEGGPEDEEKTVIEEYRSTPHLYRRLKQKINFGDMIAFKSDLTSSILKSENKDPSSGFIKRVIGVPGDKIELRDGFVYRNGELLDEPYITTPRSTYGGEILKDCEVVTVPEASYFVLGDNRKVSSDSRYELGMVRDQDIQFFLPLMGQELYKKLWRDTSQDEALLGQPTLLPSEFLKLVNAERKKNNLSPMSIHTALNKSSALRGDRLLHDKNTNFSLSQAMSTAGYSNIVLGEFVSHGRFSASELLANLLYNSGTAKQILSSQYSDLGLSAVTREIDGCPTQIIVGHLGGYIPAEYSEEAIASWITMRDNLDKILPSWEKAKEYNSVDQDKLRQLLSILYRRRNLAQEIIEVMQANRWLSDDQEARINSDDQDAERANQLIDELNQ